ncbi:MAG: hypothetical protein E7642_03965 [Ruminococcaceae bacterium]|nr:hypothetical protein [Oscillospiraceae bacterium]
MKIMKNILIFVLCISLALSAFVLSSCDQKQNEETPTQAPATEAPAKEEEEPAVDLSAIVDEIGQDIEASIRDEILAEIKHEIANGGKERKDYINITDYVTPNTGEDVSAEIQKVIMRNRNRTIYFPDGEYILANPIQTSGNPVNSVSLHLSDGAVLKAADTWRNEGALVDLGGLEKYNSIYINGSNYYFYGGTVDGNGRADGIAISSGRETAIRGVDIINTKIGIEIKEGANNGSSDSDIRDVTIKGNGMVGSVGVKVVGYDNTFTNIDIENVHTGFLLASGGNMLRQIRVRMDIEGDEVPFGYESTVGFNVLNGTIWFENCTSEQMATGFRFSNQTLVFRGCAATWYSPVGDKEIAFECLSSFRASIVNATVDFREDVSNRAFLVSGSSGKGVIVNPIFDESLSDNKAYRNFLTDVG